MEDFNNTSAVSSLEKAYAALFSALTEEGIAPLIQTASQLFDRPVLLTDENYRLICQYPNHKLGHSIWDTLYDKGTLPVEVIQEYQQAFLQNSSTTYEPFYADWGLAEECPRIFGEVYTKNGRILGHIAIFMMGAPLGPYDLEVSRILIQALQIKMSPRPMHSLSGYLFDLLSPDTSHQVKFLASSVLSKHLKGSFCLMATPTGSSAAQKAFSAIAVNQLTFSFRNTISTIFDDCIITLFGEMSQQKHTQKERNFLKQVASTLQQTYSGSGISSCFSDFTCIRNYYQQAYYTILFQKTGTAFYDDVAPAPAFMLLLQNSSPDTFLHPALKELYCFDQEHGTQYFSTLKIYSLSMHDKDLSADRLCIHRNTLLYRLNRIRELFHLPFEEPQTALHLLNSFQLWDAHFHEFHTESTFNIQ